MAGNVSPLSRGGDGRLMRPSKLKPHSSNLGRNTRELLRGGVVRGTRAFQRKAQRNSFLPGEIFWIRGKVGTLEVGKEVEFGGGLVRGSDTRVGGAWTSPTCRKGEGGARPFLAPHLWVAQIRLVSK